MEAEITDVIFERRKTCYVRGGKLCRVSRQSVPEFLSQKEVVKGSDWSRELYRMLW